MSLDFWWWKKFIFFYVRKLDLALIFSRKCVKWKTKEWLQNIKSVQHICFFNKLYVKRMHKFLEKFIFCFSRKFQPWNNEGKTQSDGIMHESTDAEKRRRAHQIINLNHHIFMMLMNIKDIKIKEARIFTGIKFQMIKWRKSFRLVLTFNRLELIILSVKD